MMPKNSCLLQPTLKAVFYILLNIFVTRPSFKHLRFFWQKVHRCKKWPDIWKVTSSGRAEIENLKLASGDVFDFMYISVL